MTSDGKLGRPLNFSQILLQSGFSTSWHVGTCICITRVEQLCLKDLHLKTPETPASVPTRDLNSLGAAMAELHPKSIAWPFTGVITSGP